LPLSSSINGKNPLLKELGRVPIKADAESFTVSHGSLQIKGSRVKMLWLKEV
jgi:hypothetical protein